MDDSVFSFSSVDDCRIITLPRNSHENGSLSVIGNDGSFPFTVKRVYYLYDIPGDAERGGHAHRDNRSLIIAVSGCFDVTLDDGHQKRTFTLNRPYNALYVPAGLWREIRNFSSGSVCLVLTSESYSEDDYVRDYAHFIDLTREKTAR
ncbi:MAG: WxcM-like domain-containing protein [Muribaculaceae bacterium]|nr:WxcM-like domain-containing protein [Muribaculaceae bacterium]